MAELPMTRAADLAAEHVGHQLHAIADAEHRRVEVEQRRVALGRALFGDALRSTRENDADWILGAKRLHRRVERDDFGVDRELAQTTSDELCVLRPEIQDENGLMRHLGRPQGRRLRTQG